MLFLFRQNHFLLEDMPTRRVTKSFCKAFFKKREIGLVGVGRRVVRLPWGRTVALGEVPATSKKEVVLFE